MLNSFFGWCGFAGKSRSKKGSNESQSMTSIDWIFLVWTQGDQMSL
jgi:hypothetical protein